MTAILSIHPTTDIHPTAVIAEGAWIGEGTSIGPYSVIGPDVRIGAGNRIGPHVVIDGVTEIGDGNQIFQFASVGAAPQDLKWHGERTRLVIGHRNIIRENATIHPGTIQGGGETVIGDDNLLMVSSHVAHDCRLGNHVHLVNGATLAGHIEIGDYAILSGLCAVHQHARIGRHAFIAGGAMVAQDVPPFCLVQGDRARLVALNDVGLRRAGFVEADVLALRRVFRALFKSGLDRAARIEAARAEADRAHCAAGHELIEFVVASRRGLVAA
ncbi:acyl-ACP--UDP-N-acetylglucosamine O-acyltransferase [Tanticharoenia sakaeratensis]|uniref:Acyl-[acyl-carrier-protein]--UDP-N-acetylglucosamine O-acyltransferase n=1 Tax=Tanticharoenia sakaeratensis NBRC 103193 TaxID=1231623 RepID=A0A0D6MJC3_9PROT|nr:acyl-ACP--UDP-N-acetylglucosamine O-acyltransferase [Tanticharoenia sakaeratensis]GAN53591.1 acyl-(acyl-carrier-protein)--UDP-N-acetylglucosamine O-acyltransferase [Tanticharoenia sakaeratensis NBRC 103193]GBQ17456.1 UDP-N-acetylglucosamine acyltransferase [Tanticharoenia sakaeratensis NBRC 103193]